MNGFDQLTDRQAEIFFWIRRQIVEEFRPPSYREIGAQFGIASLNGVRAHLIALEKKGYLSTLPGSRGLRLVRPEHGAEVCVTCGASAVDAPVPHTEHKVHP